MQDLGNVACPFRPRYFEYAVLRVLREPFEIMFPSGEKLSFTAREPTLDPISSGRLLYVIYTQQLRGRFREQFLVTKRDGNGSVIGAARSFLNGEYPFRSSQKLGIPTPSHFQSAGF